MKHGRIITAGLAVCLLTAVTSFGKADDKTFKHDRYLLLDSRIIESTRNAKLTVGTVRKDANNPLFKEDKPWEPRFDNLYPIVMYDKEDRIYKCWSSPFIIDSATTDIPREQHPTAHYRPRKREMAVCYATSKDGILWEKPELGIVEFDGNNKNNIVFRNALGAGLFEDIRETDPAKRFKMLTAAPAVSLDHLSVVFSPDGLHWSQPILCPEINPRPHPAVDSINQVLWAPERGEYVAFTRLRGVSGGMEEVRQVGRATSKDFLKWKQAKLVFEGSDPNLQIYSMPVFRHAGLYLGLPVMYNYTSDLAFTGLAWSPDAINWQFIAEGTPLIDNGKRMGDYDWGCVYASNPVFLEEEIRLYYGASDGRHYGWRDSFFCLATLRPDGFAGYEQIAGHVVGNNKTATITTKPVVAGAGSLRLSADVVTSGYVKVTLIDKENKELAEGELIVRTVTDGEVQWKEGYSFGSLKGKEIRLRFELRDAKLYSFSFHQ